MIRLAVPTIEEDDIQAVVEVLRSGYLVQGPKVKAFEEAFGAYVGTEHCVALPNCTVALHLSLLALGIGPGDKVAVTTYSWPATANAVCVTGAEPVFVDIEPETFNMAPDALEAVLAETPGIRAVLPVHTFGGSADIEALVAIADRASIPLVEDAACALGTEQHAGGKRAGAFGRLGCFSLHPRKAITTGEGGMVTTNDAELARKIRMLRNHGQAPESPTPDFVDVGYNLRLTEFQGAMGLTQLAKAERIIAARARVARTYDELLAKTGIRPPRALPGSRHVYQSYVVMLPEDLRGKRDDVVKAMRAREVETTLGTYHMPLIRSFRERGGYKPGDFPMTDDVAARAMTLPVYEHLDADTQRVIVDRLLDSVAHVRG